MLSCFGQTKSELRINGKTEAIGNCCNCKILETKMSFLKALASFSFVNTGTVCTKMSPSSPFMRWTNGVKMPSLCSKHFRQHLGFSSPGAGIKRHLCLRTWARRDWFAHQSSTMPSSMATTSTAMGCKLQRKHWKPNAGGKERCWGNSTAYIIINFSFEIRTKQNSGHPPFPNFLRWRMHPGIWTVDNYWQNTAIWKPTTLEGSLGREKKQKHYWTKSW